MQIPAAEPYLHLRHFKYSGLLKILLLGHFQKLGGSAHRTPPQSYLSYAEFAFSNALSIRHRAK